MLQRHRRRTAVAGGVASTIRSKSFFGRRRW